MTNKACPTETYAFDTSLACLAKIYLPDFTSIGRPLVVNIPLSTIPRINVLG